VFVLIRLQKFGRLRNYKSLATFYEKCDNIIEIEDHIHMFYNILVIWGKVFSAFYC